MNLGMSANFLLNHKTIIKPLHLAQHLLHSEETIHNLVYIETEEYFFCSFLISELCQNCAGTALGSPQCILPGAPRALLP